MNFPDPSLQPEFYEYIPLKRAIALILDLIATGVVWVPIAIIFAVFVDLVILQHEMNITNLYMVTTFALASLGYRTAMLARYSATLGMMVMTLKWRKLDGDMPDALMAFRYSLIHLGQYIVLPVQFISFVMMLSTPYRQGVSDYLFGTTMLHRSAPD